MLFSWVTPLVRRGAAGQLQYDQLLPVPPDTTPRACASALWRKWTKTCAAGRPSLLRALLGAYGAPYYRLALLKLCNDSLTFAGTMLLNQLVQQLEAAHASSSRGGSNGSSNGGCSRSAFGGLLVWLWPGWWCTPGSACWGYSLAGLLGASVIAKAIIGSHYNMGLNLVTIRLRAGVMGVLFRTSLLSRAADASGDGDSEGTSPTAAASKGATAAADVNTLMAVDAGRLANLALSVQELWSLPLQIVAAMTLLYLQVRTAFIAGVLLCVALIPINRLIAQRIQAASVSMMAAKDARVGLMGELLRHLATVKALGWEGVLGHKILTHRSAELQALAVRKYLDAICVYLWAATQLLLSGTTFGLMVLLGQPLRPSVVFTSLALFNVLIAPLNAFPWVVNGVVEALVSLRRIQTYLLLPQRCPEWAYGPQLLPSILAAQQQQQQQAAAATGSSGDGSSGGAGGCCGRGKQKQQQQQQRLGQGQEGGKQQQNKQQQMGHSLWVAAGGSSSSSQASQFDMLPHALDSSAAVQFCDASFAWKRGQPPCLSDLRLSIPAGCLTAVVGEVGAGKSSLLSAILGELDLVGGHALLPQHACHQQPPQLGSSQQQPQQQGTSQQLQQQGSSQQPQQQPSTQPQQQQQSSTAVLLHPHRIGYVSQAPWLMRGSVRDNVLLGQPYDAEVLGEIYHAVGLDTDLAAMPAGDLTSVGEGGSALSGGQRLRVALARALYLPHARLFLLDDLLASLDGHVAQWVIRHTLFGGLLAGATVVMVTKHPLVIQAAQLVVALQQGRVAFTGSPSAYAHWKAQQQAPVAVGVGAGVSARSGSGSGGVGAVSNGWTPLVRHTVAPTQAQWHHQQPQQLPPSEAPGLSSTSSAAATDSSPTAAASTAATAAASTAATAATTAAAAEISLDSEDVPVSELMMAGGQGVWAPHASLAPQLNVISEEEGPLDSAGSSGVLLDGCSGSSGSSSDGGGGSSDGSWEVVGPALGSGSSGQQQQPREGQEADNGGAFRPSPRGSSGDAGGSGGGGGDGGGDSSSSEPQPQPGAAAAAAASAAAAAVAGGPRAGRRVSFSSDVISADDDKQQQQQQQQQQQREEQHESEEEEEEECVPGGCDDAEESRAVGAVGWRVYSTYFRAVGLFMCCAVLGSLVAMQATKNGVDLWVTSSLSHNNTTATANTATNNSSSSSSITTAARVQVSRKLLLLLAKPAVTKPSAAAAAAAPLDPEMTRFLKGLAVISGLNTLATLARAFTFAAAGMAAARSVHRRLLAAVLAAPLAAFDSQPAGRLLNRFSSDTSVLDDSLPFIMNILLANAVSLAGLLAVLLYSQPLLLLVVLPLGVVYRRLQLFYRSTARELRRLEAVGLSPLYGLFTDTAAGAPTLRAASAQAVFVQRFTTAMEPYQAACVNNAAASNWLSMRLQLLAAVLLSAVAALAAVVAAAAGAAPDNPFLPGGSSSSSSSSSSWFSSSTSSSGSWASGGSFRVDLLGLALAYCLPIVNLLNGLLSSSAETEQDMVGVERIAALIDALQPEEREGQGRGGVVRRGQQQQQQQTQQSVWQQRLLQRQQRQQRRRGPPGSSSDSEGSGLSEPLLQGQADQQQQQQWEASSSSAAAAAAAVAAEAAAVPALQLIDVVMRYRPGLPPALRGVSLQVPVGGKLGVCGRTGAGKSSLLSVLLRLRPIQSGLIKVFGRDAKTLSVRDLRSHFAVVPQQPVLFQGSLRENLDPWGRATDEQLAATLQAVHMWAPLCRIALHRKLLGHSTYLMARRAGSLLPPPPGAAATQAPSGHARGDSSSSTAWSQPNQQQQRQDRLEAAAAAAAGGASAWDSSSSSTDADAEVAAIAAEWSTRRRAAPFVPTPAALLLSSTRQEDGSAGGSASGHHADHSAAAAAMGGVSCCLDSRALEEGAALAVGAAAGAVDAAAAAQRHIQHTQAAGGSRTASASASSSSLSFRRIVQAVIGSQRLSRPLSEVFGRRSSASGGAGARGRPSDTGSFVLPPVPMHPAHKVLSMQVGSGPSALSLSAGQAQLVCVARCLLSGAPLVLLDEATAAVDPRTAALIHQVLHEQFDAAAPRSVSSSSSASSSTPAWQPPQQPLTASSSSSAAPHSPNNCVRPTVIQIAHELSAIMSYDAVAVMSGGQVAETGNPQQLAAQQGSRFSRLLAQEGH